jgi:hypothetical protein
MMLKTFKEISREYGHYGTMLAFHHGAVDYRNGTFAYKHMRYHGEDAIAYDKGTEAAMREAAGEKR